MWALMSLRQTRVPHSVQFWYSDFILLAMSVAGTPSEGRYARQYGQVHLLFFILVAIHDRQNTWPQRVRTGWCSTSRHTEQSKEVMGSFGSALRSRVVVPGAEEAGADLELSLLSREPIAALPAGCQELRAACGWFCCPSPEEGSPGPAGIAASWLGQPRRAGPLGEAQADRATRRCRSSRSPESETRTLHPRSEFRKVQLENNRWRRANSLWPPSWNLNKPQSRPMTISVIDSIFQ